MSLMSIASPFYLFIKWRQIICCIKASQATCCQRATFPLPHTNVFAANLCSDCTSSHTVLARFWKTRLLTATTQLQELPPPPPPPLGINTQWQPQLPWSNSWPGQWDQTERTCKRLDPGYLGQRSGVANPSCGQSPFANVDLRLVCIGPNSFTTLVMGSCSSHQHLALIPPCTTIAQAEAAVPPTPVSGCVAMSPRRDEPAAAGALHLAYNQSWHLHGNSSRCCIPNGSQGTATLSQAAVAINFCLGHLQGSKRIMQKKLIRGIETTLNSVIASTIPLNYN